MDDQYVVRFQHYYDLQETVYTIQKHVIVA